MPKTSKRKSINTKCIVCKEDHYFENRLTCSEECRQKLNSTRVSELRKRRNNNWGIQSMSFSRKGDIVNALWTQSGKPHYGVYLKKVNKRLVLMKII